MRRPPKNKWARGEYKRAIVEQRKFLWAPDYVKLLARWLGFRQGMTVVDVGCGLGYLGTLYWTYFGRGGRYIGIDISPKLTRKARIMSHEWVKGGRATFAVGDALSLPLPDNYADIVMCQTLLMHLPEPSKALAEMKRVAKPGGLVVCKEPDNLSSWMGHPCNSLPERPIEEELFFKRTNLLCAKGSVALGRGDFSIGAKVPLMMDRVGLVDVDVKMNDQPWVQIPPYGSPRQQYIWKCQLKAVRRQAGERRKFMLQTKKLLLAGGGTMAEYRRITKLTSGNTARNKLYKKQLRDGTYYSCGSGPFYVIKGRKPPR
jgi:SAM-dependent methyltransferase